VLSTCEELSTYEDKIESVAGDAIIDIVNHDHAFTERNREGEGEREIFFFFFFVNHDIISVWIDFCSKNALDFI
jgi:hypothetical protein